MNHPTRNHPTRNQTTIAHAAYVALLAMAALLTPAQSVLAQTMNDDYSKPAEFGVAAGYHGFGGHFVEIGIGRAIVSRVNGITLAQTGFSLTTELKVDAGFRYGVVLTAWTQLPLIALGVNVAWYVDPDLGFADGSLKLRPEIGLGLLPARLVYGYNIGLVNGGLTGLNKHELALRVFIAP